MSTHATAAAMPGRWHWVCRNIIIAFRNLTRRPRGAASPVWRAYARVLVGAVIAIGALLLTMAYVDVAAIKAARQAPRWLVGPSQFVTNLGLSGWFLVPLGGALLVMALVTAPPLTRMSQRVLASLAVRFGFLFLAIAVPGLVITIVKRLIGRARPVVAGEDAFLYKFFLWRVEYASFPSGHATTAAAAAVAFGVLWPRWRPLLWSYAIAVALSRVIVTAHHPSDAIAGLIAGAVGALLVRDWMAARRLGFTIRPDGRVDPLPGPSWTRIKRVARGGRAQ